MLICLLNSHVHDTLRKRNFDAVGIESISDFHPYGTAHIGNSVFRIVDPEVHLQFDRVVAKIFQRLL